MVSSTLSGDVFKTTFASGHTFLPHNQKEVKNVVHVILFSQNRNFFYLGLSLWKNCKKVWTVKCSVVMFANGYISSKYLVWSFLLSLLVILNTFVFPEHYKDLIYRAVFLSRELYAGYMRGLEIIYRIISKRFAKIIFDMLYHSTSPRAFFITMVLHPLARSSSRALVFSKKNSNEYVSSKVLP